jgi:hypothetical protein
MAKWLYDALMAVETRSPRFALQSSLNWMRALAFEIEAEHGTAALDQAESCRAHFRSAVLPASTAPPVVPVFGPLFSSLTFAGTATAAAETLSSRAFVQPTAVVAWYYAVYNAVRAMLAAIGQPPSDTHAAVEKAFANSLADKLPHPLNMLATYQSGEDYAVDLPTHTSASYDLTRRFEERPDVARGMLVQYLSGTADFYTKATKAKLARGHRLSSFRTAEAKGIRDAALARKIAFMHAAFRYRGKANYRDVIYLTYGTQARDVKGYLRDLATVAQFTFICAYECVRRRVGATAMSAFEADVVTNLRDFATLPPATRALFSA